MLIFLFLRFCSHLSLPSTCRLTPSPTSGDGLRFVFFRLSSTRRGRLFLYESFLYFCFCYIKLDCFFLSVSFPRMRREVPSLRGDRGKPAYTGKNIQILPPLPGFFTSFKNDGQVLILVCKNCSSCLLTLIFILSFLLTLAPSDGFAATFPDKRGRLAVCILFFLGEKSFTVSRKRNSLVPSFLSGGQNRNDNKRKNRSSEGAKNPA